MINLEYESWHNFLRDIFISYVFEILSTKARLTYLSKALGSDTQLKHLRKYSSIDLASKLILDTRSEYRLQVLIQDTRTMHLTLTLSSGIQLQYYDKWGGDIHFVL